MNRERLFFKDIRRKYSKNIDMKNLNRDINWKINSAKMHKELAATYTHTRYRKSCPICSVEEYSTFVNIYGYNYVECSECGHIYLQDYIDEAGIKNLYTGQENKSLQHMVYLSEELFNKRVNQIATPKVEWILNEIENKGLWIDIGCGTGEILFSASQKGYAVRGIDSDEKEIEFAKSKGIDVLCDYVTEINAESYIGDGDIISLFNVLEHLDKPKELVRTISNNAKEGSYIVIEVPRHPSLSSLSNLVFDEMACRHIYPPDHMHIFTEKSLDIMMQEANLKPMSTWTFGQDASEFIMTALASKNILNNKFTDEILKSELIPLLQKSIDEAGFSDTIIIICKKCNV